MTLKELVDKVYGGKTRPDYFIQFTNEKLGYPQHEYLDEMLETHGDRKIKSYSLQTEILLVVEFESTKREVKR